VKLFVAGATGVVGRRVVPLLLNRGHQATALSHSSRKASALRRLGVRPICVSLFDTTALQHAISGHEVVVNLATHIPKSALAIRWRPAWRENDRIRTIGAANLVDAAIAGGVRHFIQESFAPAYPDRGTDWIAEDTPIAPVRDNRTIADAEQSAQRFTESGRCGVVLRFGQFYGPDALQTEIMIKLVRHGWAPLPGRAEAFVSSVSHDDAAAAVIAALSASAGAYNVVDNEPLRHREYFDSLAAVLGVKPPKLPAVWMTPLFGTLGEMLARSLRVSNRKLRQATGWAPKYPSVREGWRAVLESQARHATEYS
jgi:2-alkyl-3-oxoalkanoate reductase